MTDAELEQEVRARHAAGASPKAIARALGVRPAAVIPIVRRAAAERAEQARDQVPQASRCWVNPGWSDGLTIDGNHDWPGDAGVRGPGLVSAVVARPHRYGKVSVCSYLVDAYCLGVKNALGPRVMREDELPGFLAEYYRAHEQEPIAAPIELVQHLVFGAIDYAKGLGFEPHPDFERARGHLGALHEACAIRFGYKGKPLYMQGPYDDPERIHPNAGAIGGPQGLRLRRRASRLAPLEQPHARTTGARLHREVGRAATPDEAHPAHRIRRGRGCGHGVRGAPAGPAVGRPAPPRAASGLPAAGGGRRGR